jgi:hypothetical protein
MLQNSLRNPRLKRQKTAAAEVRRELNWSDFAFSAKGLFQQTFRLRHPNNIDPLPVPP